MAAKGRTQIGYFSPETGEWWISAANKNFGEVPNSQFTVQAGSKGDLPFPGNYFNGGHIAVYRPSNNTWYIKGPGSGDWGNSSNNVTIQFGKPNDIPVPGNYFGDGTRLAVFRPSEGNWYIKGNGPENWEHSKENYVIQTGTQGDIPVPADYLGVGKSQIAVFRPSDNTWYIKGNDLLNYSSSQGNVHFKFPPLSPTDVPVPGNYFGDGKARPAWFHGENGTWLIKGPGFTDYDPKNTENLQVQTGAKGDIPVPGDYFGENKTRIAVFRPAAHTWYIKGQGFANWNGTQNNTEVKWGKAPTDVPIPFAYGL